METIPFAITGDFVTNTVRSWFWDEDKPWETVENLLLSCMGGTEESKEELRLHAIDVVFGRAKFVGNTRDGSFALTKDDDELLPIQKFAYARKRSKEYEEKYLEVSRQHSELTSWLVESGHEYLFTRFERESGHVIYGDEEPAVSPKLKSSKKEAKTEKKFNKNNYGWLDPLGNFYPAEWGEHYAWAEEKAEELGYLSEGSMSGETELSKRGWVLLHSPALGVPVVSKGDETKRLTKQQREFLFGYYTDRGLHEEAKRFLEG